MFHNNLSENLCAQNETQIGVHENSHSSPHLQVDIRGHDGTASRQFSSQQLASGRPGAAGDVMPCQDGHVPLVPPLLLPACILSSAHRAAGGELPSLSSVAQPLPVSLPNDPLLLELMKIRRKAEKETKLHELKKQRLLSKCEEEMDAVQRKYDALVDEAKTGYAEKKKFRSIMNKGNLKWILAQEVYSQFVNGGAASGDLQGQSSFSG
ncbi:uncharacterized protein LOC144706620 isoform X2 [Wolffia australiana]